MEKIIYTDKMFQPLSPSGMSKVRSSNDAEIYSVGDRYFPVLVVETADYKSLDSAMFARMFNEEGYKGNGAFGSARDYFISSSGGKFRPTFDIYPIKLPKEFGEYNKDSLFILPAIDSLVEREDFKARADKYEKVIPFIFMHPTSREKALTYDDIFFNHMYSLQYSAKRIYSKNGYRFNHYAFVAQKAEGKPYAVSSNYVGMLGTYVHEFSHVIGLQDLYSVDSRGYATIGPLPYDVMTLGLRNGGGGYPPTFSAFEREAMGWLKLTEITNSDSVYELKAISEMQAYAVSNPLHPDEYYIIEYRPAVGFDSKIENSTYNQMRGKNGVFIWYIDYDRFAFESNDPNGDVDHQRVEVKTVLSEDQEYFEGFEFVNSAGKSPIEGVFNFVFDGDERVCFTVNRSKPLTKCPEKVVVKSSSSSITDLTSSSSVVKSSSSRGGSVSSSSESLLLVRNSVSEIRLRSSSNKIEIEVPLAGVKTLRFYDALGCKVGSFSFAQNSASIDISGWNRPAYMQLEMNGRVIFAKRVVF